MSKTHGQSNLPVQLVEHRTGIAEVAGSNPVEALIFFFLRLLLSNSLNWKIYCDDPSSLSSTTAIISYILHKIKGNNFQEENTKTLVQLFSLRSVVLSCRIWNLLLKECSVPCQLCTRFNILPTLAVGSFKPISTATLV